MNTLAVHFDSLLESIFGSFLVTVSGSPPGPRKYELIPGGLGPKPAPLQFEASEAENLGRFWGDVWGHTRLNNHL